MSLASRLYQGQTEIDFVGKRRLWFSISAVAVLISLVALIVPGLNFGIDFKGGASFEAISTKSISPGEVQTALGSVAQQIQVTKSTPPRVQVQTKELSQEQVINVRQQLTKLTGDPNPRTNAVGSTWGSTVSRKALLALFVFLIAIVIYVSIRFEFKMAIAALIALVHDLIITAGIYALLRFEVTPATVIAILTILGYSLYDTVVVFDKVRENTGAISSVSRVTYSDLANRAVNQTLVRSLNTSLASLLPIGALLFVGAILLGAETIKDLGLALFIGVAAGTYSSIFVATPIVAAWKETEPRNAQLRARLARQPTMATASAGAASAAPATRTSRPAGAAKGARPVAGDGAASARPVPGDRAAAQPARPARKRTGSRAAGSPRPAAPTGGAHSVFDDEEQAPALPDLEPDPVEPDGEAEAEAVSAPAAAAASTRPSGGNRPRPAQQQRRKQGGRQPSRPAKRRRR